MYDIGHVIDMMRELLKDSGLTLDDLTNAQYIDLENEALFQLGQLEDE